MPPFPLKRGWVKCFCGLAADFLVPGIDEYRNPAFPVGLLTMLGVKSSCKERWRQVLAEADRIEHKHLLTLEPGISTNQTDEMRAKRLQLVVPEPVHATFSASSGAWLCNAERFLQFAASRQAGVWERPLDVAVCRRAEWKSASGLTELEASAKAIS
jgi:hypothetical protein